MSGIEHSAAFQALEKYAARSEPKEINFPVVQEKVGTVFARPLSCAEVDKLEKVSGHEYNVRLCMLACVDRDGNRVFNPEDFAGLYAAKGTMQAFALAANQISAAQVIDFDSLKKD